MTNRPRNRESGFTLVELTIVVVISTIALVAIYQSLITQERTYRYQSAAIDTQGSTRVGLQVLASELREISASAGVNPAVTGGSDLVVATSDSVRIRALRKVGLSCAIDTLLGIVDAWVPGAPFEVGDTLMMFQEADTVTDSDDTWALGVRLSGVGVAVNTLLCRAEWNDYPLQALQGLDPAELALMERGGLIRSYNTITYGAYTWDGEWVLGRRNPDGEVVPLVGPLLSPDDGGLVFRYFDENGNTLTPTTEAQRGAVSRIEITVRALSRGGIDGNYVDSLSTNVYLRGN